MGEIFSGWKDIAKYMGKGVRTVQRYGRERGLPVRRISGKPNTSVLMTKTELDAWINSTFSREAANGKLPPHFEKLKSRTTELRAAIEQLNQSINKLGTVREELAMSQRTIRQTARRVRENVIQARIPRKDDSL